MATQVDLRELAVQRPDKAAPLVRKRPWLTRWGIPLLIIVGFVGVIGWSAQDLWIAKRSVTVTPVVLMKAEVQTAGTPLFQAAGWVEPRPTAVVVSALEEGVVNKLLVVEGEEVVTGQPLAQLFDETARLAVREAIATKELRAAELKVLLATVKAAQQNVDTPVHLEASLAEAEASTAKIVTEINNLPFAVRIAESRLQLAQQDLEGKLRVADSLPGRLIQQSQSDFDSARASLEELKQRKTGLEAERNAWQRKCEALEKKLRLKTDEVRGLEEATAQADAARARVTQAELSIENAELRLARMTIRAPINGRVLALNAQPGRRVMGINAASERDASTVLSLYDPQKLQIRADVRLENVAEVQVGQPVEITSDAYGGQLTGHVLAITSSADIQKNTLQVKVAIDSPPSVIKPEMLMQVVFQSPSKPESFASAEQETLRLLVPREILVKSDSGTVVWVADAAGGVARRRTVELGRAGTDLLVEVKSGLTALDKLIASGREGVKDGERILITGEDQTIGITRTANLRSAEKAASSDISPVKQ